MSGGLALSLSSLISHLSSLLSASCITRHDAIGGPGAGGAPGEGRGPRSPPLQYLIRSPKRPSAKQSTAVEVRFVILEDVVL